MSLPDFWTINSTHSTHVYGIFNYMRTKNQPWKCRWIYRSSHGWYGLYIYTYYLEPKWPLFLKVTPSKTRLFPSKTYFHHLFESTTFDGYPRLMPRVGHLKWLVWLRLNSCWLRTVVVVVVVVVVVWMLILDNYIVNYCNILYISVRSIS